MFVRACSVVSDSLRLHGLYVVFQAPLSMEFFQARILEQVVISFSRGSSWPRDWTHISCVSCIGRQILYHWTTREACKKKERKRHRPAKKIFLKAYITLTENTTYFIMIVWQCLYNENILRMSQVIWQWIYTEILSDLKFITLLIHSETVAK